MDGLLIAAFGNRPAGRGHRWPSRGFAGAFDQLDVKTDNTNRVLGAKSDSGPLKAAKPYKRTGGAVPGY